MASSSDERSPAERGFGAFEPRSHLRLCPEDILSGVRAKAAVAEGTALPLGGGPLAFAAVEAIERNSGGSTSHYFSLSELNGWIAAHDRLGLLRGQLDRLSAPRPPWANFPLDRPLIVGILNVTPDSFSDGGAFFDQTSAVDRAKALIDLGADVVDVGGESTRPGALETPPEEELRRVVPVIAALARQGAVVSVDTRRAAVMRASIDAGARIVNDVTALTGDPASLDVVASSGAAVVLMHMAGEPGTMQRAPAYDDVTLDVLDYLEARIAACEAAGIPRARIMVDPGVGFGKHMIDHNLPLLRRIALMHATGCGVLVGLSRKAFIGRLSRGEPPQQRAVGSVAGALWCVSRGVQAMRVHDVAETRQALAVWGAIAAGVP